MHYSSLLKPQGQLTPAEALQLAQRAPEMLRINPRAFSASPLKALFSATETPQLWTIYENLLLSCLRAGNDECANECLQRLTRRFGAKDDRIMALQGLQKEAQASSDAQLDKVLAEYETILEEDGANIPVHKRRIALLRSIGRVGDSITALNNLLEFSPTDSEAWAELADMYLSEGLYQQAVYALEEVLLLVPHAWNMHARLGEVSLMAASASGEGSQQKHLAEALKRYCRSIELCDDYLRGYYGLKMVTDKLLHSGVRPKKQDSEGFSLPEQATIEKLNQLATQKLAEIVRRYGAQEKCWQGYDATEVEAARHLLGKSSSDVVR
ncbi:hypothetical protein CDD81_3768 [Ophiocordyceps australis]|uniref:ER membrane protein complex subunit 2 n=1 Tax=Ophiocordyceps australis TaxID=1399860 RepID=A0A2C5YDG9_9HYPO|nr:hypothetical protein CDD81_3768 [Ophiocordyceps australis]